MKLTRLAPLALGGVLLAGGFAGSSLAQQPPAPQGAQAGQPGAACLDWMVAGAGVGAELVIWPEAHGAYFWFDG